jgi:uncharacterized protein YbdZ (MbtH family)
MKVKSKKAKGKIRISVLHFCLFTFALLLSSVSAQNKLETRAFEMKGCIQTIYTKQFVITDNASYLKTIRDDASRAACLKKLEKIDFAKHTLLGIDINSGYCGIPAGLKYQTVKDEAKKQYIVTISYLDPKYEVCRAVSQYDLWLLVPKLPAGYDVKFEEVKTEN